MKPVFWPLVLNLVGVGGALLYGIGGGSGGETTEGVFGMLWVVGWVTLLVAFVVLLYQILRRNWVGQELALLVVMMVIGFLETRLVVSDAMMWRDLFH